MWNCPGCGKENREDRSYCWHCTTRRESSTVFESPVIGHCGKCNKPILQNHPYVWCDACGEPISDDVNWKRKPKHDPAPAQNQEFLLSNEADAGDAVAQPAQPMVKAEPISTEALGFLRVVGSTVAILGIIAGILILVNTPEGPNDTAIKYRSDELPVQIHRTTRLIYLSLGWGQIIGSIVIGVLLNVVAGIGNAVLDIWKAPQSR